MRRVLITSLLALLAGLAGGLAYAWVLAPLRVIDTAPSALRSDFKDQFRMLIAASYSATHNLDRARARLALLGDANPIEALSAQAQRMLASGESFQVVQQVAGLASDLQSEQAAAVPTGTVTLVAAVPPTLLPPTMLSATAAEVDVATKPTTSPADATPPAVATSTPVFDTPTPRPTWTPVPTASAPFELVSQDQVCNPNLTNGLMQVSVLDARKHQMPGVEIDISWAGGEEAFFTGLKPEIANGYVDYIMQAGVIYSVRVGRAGDAVPNLTAPPCPTSNGQSYVGGLKLVFQQP